MELRSILTTCRRSGLRRAFARIFGFRRRLAEGVGLILLSLTCFSSNCFGAEPMTFRLVSAAGSTRCAGACVARIAAKGEITDSTPADFGAFLRSNSLPRGAGVLVFINSPGGKIAAAIELGKIFRRTGATVAVAGVAQDGGAVRLVGGICCSACVYALMGAKKRIAPRQSVVGIHRMFAKDGASLRLDNGAFAAVLKRYSKMMGVSPDLIAAAERVTPDALRILTPAEMARWRLASPGS
jgi:membrane-bound ClpP family serine protease